ncbi:unnamed protein product, partial [marine sediment metagenome]
GGRGGWAGWARGGGIYIAPDSSPTFINCTISDCTATGGNAGDGANGAEGETDGIPWEQPPGYGGNRLKQTNDNLRPPVNTELVIYSLGVNESSTIVLVPTSPEWLTSLKINQTSPWANIAVRDGYCRGGADGNSNANLRTFYGEIAPDNTVNDINIARV